MAKPRISPAVWVILLLIAFFIISLVIRVYLPYDGIFVGDTIKYANNDSYYYMRLIDNVTSHFPHMTQFDPYYIYPGGNNITSLPFFHWIIAFLAWVIGLGHPTQHLIDMIGVYLPVVMAALTVIPVFFIGKALFNKWAGVLAAGLIAVFPGEYLARSMLGATDNPVAETLFTTVALAFLIYAVKSATQNQLTFNNIWKRDWKVILKPLLCSLFAGIFLGLYLATWQGALIFVFIIAIYLVVQFIINHIRQKSSDYLCIVGFITYLFALILLLLNPFTADVTIAMVLMMLLPLALYGISRALSRLKTFYYPLVLVVIAAAAVGIFYAAAPSTFQVLFDKFKFVFFPSGASAVTTTEMTPALIPQGDFTTLTIWGNYTTSFFIAPWWLFLGLATAALCGYIFYRNDKSNPARAMFVFFILALVMVALVAVQQLPSGYGLTSAEVKFIPGLGLIGLSILLYLLAKRDAVHRWQTSFGWVVTILVLLTGVMLFAAYQDIRYLVIVPVAMLAYILFMNREGDEQLRLFLIWSLIILILPMIQRRFQYYLVVNMALCSGFLVWEIIRLSGINRLQAKTETATKPELSFATVEKSRDYYELLGISKTASAKEIVNAYRNLTAPYRSATERTPEAEARFKELNKAQQVLTNPTQRAAYDKLARQTEKKKPSSRKGKPGNILNLVNVLLAIVVVFLFVYLPNIAKAQDQAPNVTFAISDEWQDALVWLRGNSPEPFGDDSIYYKDYDALAAGQAFDYPATAYGVTAWWDYGYYITRIAHRIPNCNPSQSSLPIIKVANFFLAQDQATYEALRKELGSAYIVTDYLVSVSKLPAVLQWANADRDKYLPVYYLLQDNALMPAQVFSLDYYRTLVVRLYNFDAKAVTETAPTVVIYKMVRATDGSTVKQITDVQEFKSYQEALDYIDSHPSTTSFYDIVGTDPFASPIPLDAVSDYEEVYISATSSNESQPVKVFKYIGTD
jgi:oligosaccharyl transferase (archaeosortase A-associated)